MFLVYLVCFLGACFPVTQQAHAAAVNPTITQFSLATDSIGLLAHSYQEGENFMALESGSVITLNGEKSFQVEEIQVYKRDPGGVRGGATDLLTGKHYTVEELFENTYGRDGYLVLQTCLEQGDNKTWGLIFFLAKPIVEIHDIPQRMS